MRNKSTKNKSAGGLLHFLYNTAPGRILLRPLICRPVSIIAGAFLSTPLSKPMIKGFLKKNNIVVEDYVCDGFRCFNDCFVRKIKDGKRPFDSRANAYCAPCDGHISAYVIDGDTVIPAKQSRYTVNSLLGGDKVAEKYKNGGICIVYRLCVDNYHRYAYNDSGVKGDNVFIKGKLHTVRPIALESCPVFTENCREYTVMETENFGTVTQVEVGAMMVGKIKNHHGAGSFSRGEEKGMFLFGGSTVIQLIEKGRIEVPAVYFEKTKSGEEIPCKMGEVIGFGNKE